MGQIFLEYSWTILFKTMKIINIVDDLRHRASLLIRANMIRGPQKQKGKMFPDKIYYHHHFMSLQTQYFPNIEHFCKKKTFLHKYFSPLQWAKYEPSMSLVAISYCRLAHAGSFLQQNICSKIVIWLQFNSKQIMRSQTVLSHRSLLWYLCTLLHFAPFPPPKNVKLWTQQIWRINTPFAKDKSIEDKM